MVGPELVQGDEAVVYADRGYDAARMREHLQAQGIACGIMRRGKRNQPLPPEEVEHNSALVQAPAGRSGLRHPQALVWLPSHALLLRRPQRPCPHPRLPRLQPQAMACLRPSIN